MNDRHQLFLGLFILMGTVVLGIWQWSTLNALQAEALALQSEANHLSTLSESLADDYQDVKVDVTADRETKEQELAQVFPNGEELTSLTRMLDSYAVKNNFSTNPFFINSIRYGAVSTPEGAHYRFVPLNISLEASKKNLNKFIEMIEGSGSLEAGDRLMSLENLHITYPSEFGGSYTMTGNINAYFAPDLQP
jgi:hypothetical protein